MIRHVFIVDDDEAVRGLLRALLGTRSDLVIHPFRSGDAFLARLDELEAGVALIDFDMPGANGMEVLRLMGSRGHAIQSIMITGHGDVALAVRAMREGAYDFLEKPFDHQALLDAVDAAFAHLDRIGADRANERQARAKLSALSERERTVLNSLIDGHSNKQIALDLSISPRTVEYYRANLMAKLEVGSLPEALRVAFKGGMFT